MHLTAMFIGDRRERERPEVEESVRAACAGIAPFELRSVRLAALPERGLKRTIVLECDRPAGLLELHARLAQRFARDLRPNARDRFLPHITIGRFRGMGVECSLDLPLSGPAFTVDRAHLVASVLRPEGAVHRDLLTVQLSAN